MAKDISKKTVLVILLVAIVVSVVGTWTVLDAASSANIAGPPRAEGGKVSLTIGEGASTEPSITGGVVALTIA